ncbi:MAG: chromate transporter [Spirochaetaceae bacterium]|nr:chromate transporter [Spirochaetaceae bacterium]
MIYLNLFVTFFKITITTFGGGMAMLAPLQHGLKDKLTPHEINDYFSLAQSLPGAIPINAAVLIGSHLAGKGGAIVCVLAVIAPSYLVVSLIVVGYNFFLSNPIQAALMGIRAAAAALIIHSACKMLVTVIKKEPNFKASLFKVSAFIFAVLMMLLGFSPSVIIILIIALASSYYLYKRRLA